ncbi:hypothetical protein PtB15_16B132 [Puccinia triticina]|nr:hypothetical protein PtB15_16B132 [Puccinia triticina]
MTLRKQRLKDLALNSRGGVANLVQKFESPRPSPQKAIQPDSPVVDDVPKPTNVEECSAQRKPLKTNPLLPATGMDKAASHIDRNQSFDSLLPWLTGKQPAQ